MLPWLKRFFMDETVFVGLIRGVLMGFGMAQVTGNLDAYIGDMPDLVGIVAVSAGGFIRSSTHRRVGVGDEPK